MSGSPAFELQKAVYARLNGDTTLVTTLGASVYDDTPDKSNYPYVVIGECTEVPNDTMGTTGRDMTLTIHAWSQKPGKKQVKDILSRIDQLLDRWTPTVVGWNSVQMLFEFSESFRDEDGITRHGVARYRTHNHQ